MSRLSEAEQRERIEKLKLNGSFTKRGPGRMHVYGDGKPKRDAKPDSMDRKWHLSPMAIAERKRANVTR